MAAGDVATYQEPFVCRGLLIHAHVQIQGYSFWVKKPLRQRLLEAVLREGSRRYYNLHLAPGPSQLLLVTSGIQTVHQVKLLSPSLWPVLSAEMQRHNLTCRCSAKKHPWCNQGGLPGPTAQALQYSSALLLRGFGAP